MYVASGTGRIGVGDEREEGEDGGEGGAGVGRETGWERMRVG